MASLTQRMKGLTKKYGKVAVGVHLSVSALCFTGCYVAIKNSLHVEDLLVKVGLVKATDISGVEDSPSISSKTSETEKLESIPANVGRDSGALSSVETKPFGERMEEVSTGERQGGTENSVDFMAKGVVQGGGAIALAFLCNKALLPVRVPMTFALTPPIWRFLASRGFKV